MSSQVDFSDSTSPVQTRQAGGVRKLQARAAAPWLLRQWRGGKTVTARDVGDALQAAGVISSSSRKGVGDALGIAEGGLGLWRNSYGGFPPCRENFNRCMQYVGPTGWDKLLADAGFDSREALAEWAATLPPFSG
jgi:hypothetical protein